MNLQTHKKNEISKHRRPFGLRPLDDERDVIQSEAKNLQTHKKQNLKTQPTSFRAKRRISKLTKNEISKHGRSFGLRPLDDERNLKTQPSSFRAKRRISKLTKNETSKNGRSFGLRPLDDERNVIQSEAKNLQTHKKRNLEKWEILRATPSG